MAVQWRPEWTLIFFGCPDLCRFRLMPGSHTSHTTNVHHDFRHKTIRTILSIHPLESLSRRHHGLSLLPAVPPCWCNHCHPWWIGQLRIWAMKNCQLLLAIPTVALLKIHQNPYQNPYSTSKRLKRLKLTMKQRQASHQPPQRFPVTSTSGVPHGCQFHSPLPHGYSTLRISLDDDKVWNLGSLYVGACPLKWLYVGSKHGFSVVWSSQNGNPNIGKS